MTFLKGQEVKINLTENPLKEGKILAWYENESRTDVHPKFIDGPFYAIYLGDYRHDPGWKFVWHQEHNFPYLVMSDQVESIEK